MSGSLLSLRKASLEASAEKPRCAFCGDAVTCLADYLLLNNRWHVPGTRFGVELPLAFFAHGNCADEVDPLPFLYSIELKRIVAQTSAIAGGDSLTGWRQHLKEKPWYLPEMGAGLLAAHAIAKRFAPSRSAAKHDVVPITRTAKLRDIRVRDARARVTAKLRLWVFARDGHRCRKCGGGAPLELDHIIPVSRGGSSDPDNLQSLCVPCNRRKRDKVEEES